MSSNYWVHDNDLKLEPVEGDEYHEMVRVDSVRENQRVAKASMAALLEEVDAITTALERKMFKAVDARLPELRRRMETYKKAFEAYGEK